MNFNLKIAHTFLPLLIGATATVAELRASNPSVTQVAQEITVRIDGVSSGSGVIVDRKGNTYYVLTNAHVFQQREGYGIITPDGKRYPIEHNSLKTLPGIDLALVSFRTNLNYRVATLGNSEQIIPGQKVYVSGWSKSGGSLREQIWVTTEGIVTETQSKLGSGYSITYSNLVRVGMSGGPVLDGQGKVIAINGIVRLENNNSNNIVASGIAIDKFIRWLKSQNLSLTSPNVNPSPSPIAVSTSPFNFIVVHQLLSEKTSVNSIALDKNNALCVSGDARGNITIWDLKNGGIIKTWQAHKSGVKTLIFTPDSQGIISGGEDGKIKIWQGNTGELIKEFNPYQGAISSLAITPDGKMLISGGADQKIKILNLTVGEVIQTLTGHSASITALSLSANQQILASGSMDSTISIWNLKTGQVIRSIQSNDLSVLSLAISPDSKTLVNGGARGIIDIWDLATGKLVKSFKGHNDAIWTIAFSPDGNNIISGGWDRTIKLWESKTAILINTLRGHSAYISAIAMSQNGRYLVSGDWNGQILVWQTGKGN
jgi:WD40 repeat protein